MRLTALFCTFAILVGVGCCQLTPRQIELIENDHTQTQRIERAADAGQYVYRVYAPPVMGSAVPWNEEWLLTCTHVVSERDPAELYVKRGKFIWNVLEVVPIVGMDASLLRIKPPLPGVSPTPEVPERRSSSLSVGERLTLVGHAMDNPAPIITEGHYAGKWRFVRYSVDGTIIPGMSGGPVFDIDGKLIGICQAVTNNPYGRVLGLVEPTSTIERRLNAMGFPDFGPAEGPPD